MNIKELHSGSSDVEKKIFCDSYLRLWNHKDNLQFLSFTGIPFEENQIQFWISELGYRNPIQYYYIEEENRIIAILIISNDMINGFELFALCIDPEYKEKGIGDYLIKKTIEIAQINNHKAVKTVIFADNLKMQRLILKNGFIPINIQNSKRYDGVGLVEYQKRITI